MHASHKEQRKGGDRHKEKERGLAKRKSGRHKTKKDEGTRKWGWGNKEASGEKLREEQAVAGAALEEMAEGAKKAENDKTEREEEVKRDKSQWEKEKAKWQKEKGKLEETLRNCREWKEEWKEEAKKQKDEKEDLKKQLGVEKRERSAANVRAEKEWARGFKEGEKEGQEKEKRKKADPPTALVFTDAELQSPGRSPSKKKR